LIVDIQDMRAGGSDGQELMSTIARVEQHAGLTVERIIGDGAYGSGENRVACAMHQDRSVDLLAPVAQPDDPAVDKLAFALDLTAQTVTCPQGQTVTAQAGSPKLGLPTLRFTFLRATCESCPLFKRCVKSKTAGRTVQTPL
jgi:hypothetical protein